MKKKSRHELSHGMTFRELVIKAALAIPSGRVTTYGRIARAAGGAPILAQTITNILGNAWKKGEVDIPFHRIVYADGRIWTSPERHKERLKLYKREGIQITPDNKIRDFKTVLFEFD